jgi:uncharacterized protein
MVRHGAIFWHELNTHDAVKARAFYTRVARWRFEERLAEGRPYTLCYAENHVVAGIFAMEGPDFDGVPDHWLAYIQVADANLAARQVVEQGGSVMRGPFDIAGVGRLLIVREPGGAVGGYCQPEGGTR